VFAIDRAGLVGGDGATHQGSYDLSFLRCLPNLVVMAPSDENECRQMLYTATTLAQPAAVRYPRGLGSGAAIVQAMTALPVGKAVQRREGHSGLTILAFGTLLSAALQTAEQLDASVLDMRFVPGQDPAATVSALVATVDAAVAGRGLGCDVCELMTPIPPYATVAAGEMVRLAEAVTGTRAGSGLTRALPRAGSSQSRRSIRNEEGRERCRDVRTRSLRRSR